MLEYRHFYKTVDLSSREDMVQFLKSHFRYNTMNGWNNMTSYANNIKVYNLGLDKQTEDAVYDMLEIQEVYDSAAKVLTEFMLKYDGEYQMGTNGRSSGYMVLYTGMKMESQYRSVCMNCGQKNYQPASGSSCTCGKCGKTARINLNVPSYSYSVSSKSIDQDENFDEWTDEELQERVSVVQDFDAACDKYVERFLYFVENYTVQEEIIEVPATVKTLKEKEAAGNE